VPDEHIDEVWRMLGYDDPQIAQQRRDGIVEE
jgi:hypothetical protein